MDSWLFPPDNYVVVLSEVESESGDVRQDKKLSDNEDEELVHGRLEEVGTNSGS